MVKLCFSMLGQCICHQKRLYNDSSATDSYSAYLKCCPKSDNNYVDDVVSPVNIYHLLPFFRCSNYKSAHEVILMTSTKHTHNFSRVDRFVLVQFSFPTINALWNVALHVPNTLNYLSVHSCDPHTRKQRNQYHVSHNIKNYVNFCMLVSSSL